MSATPRNAIENNRDGCKCTAELDGGLVRGPPAGPGPKAGLSEPVRGSPSPTGAGDTDPAGVEEYGGGALVEGAGIEAGGESTIGGGDPAEDDVPANLKHPM